MSRIHPKEMLIPARRWPFPGIIPTFMGRDAISIVVAFLKLRHCDYVLLPAYTCMEAIKPFLRTTNVLFYRVDSSLAADLDDIIRKCERYRPKLLMIINYFGFLQPKRLEIKRICEGREIVLLEDSAHSLLTKGSGDIGDLVVYSYAKILPVPDGGGLKIKLDAVDYRPRFAPEIYSTILSVGVILKSMLNIRIDSLSRSRLTSSHQKNDSRSNNRNSRPRILPMSIFSRKAISRVDLADVIKKRRRDFHFWLDLSRRTRNWQPLYSDLPQGVCPLGFPIVTKRRQEILERLGEESIRLKIHWHLPSAISSEFSESHRLSAETITFPIYPDLTPKVKEAIERLTRT